MEWNLTVRAGLLLAALVVVWQLVSVPLGLTAVFVPIAFGLQVVVVVALLVRTRAEHGYGQQVLAAAVLSAIAVIPIFVGSLVVTMLLFPGHAALADGSPLEQALAGVIGTLVSGPAVAALAAIGLRRAR